MKKVNAAVFDMDGVIFDTESVWKQAFENANSVFGLKLDEEYRQSTCGKSEDMIRKSLQTTFPDLDVDKYRGYMLKQVNDTINNGDFDVKPGIIDAIKMLRSKNYKIALATSSHKSRAEMLFRKKGLDLYGLFDATVFAEDVGSRSKPDPEIFFVASRLINERPADCFVFEDSLNGIEAAVNGGFIPVMIVDLIEPTKYCYDNCRKIIRSCEGIRSLTEEYENY